MRRIVLRLFALTGFDRRHMRSATIALLIAVLGAVALHLYDCQTGTTDQCLVSRGLVWVYMIALFLPVWFCGACVEALIKLFSASRENK